MISFTLLEQNLHAFGHVYSQEHVRVADDGGGKCKEGCLYDWILPQKFLPKCLYSQIPLDHKRTIQASKYADENVEYNFEEVPCPVIFDLEHDQLSRSEWVHSLACC